jgi:hypothetical protein
MSRAAVDVRPFSGGMRGTAMVRRLLLPPVSLKTGVVSKEPMDMRGLLAVVIVASMCAAGCGDDSPAGPSGPTVPTFTAELLPSNEVPAVTNADSTGRGTVTVTLNVTRNASQVITAATAEMAVTLSGFPANTNLTGAHIHGGRAGLNGGVLVNTGIALGQIILANGSGSFTRSATTSDAGPFTTTVAENMLNDPAGFYFNVHTTLNTGGAVRNQLTRVQ